MKSFTLVLFFSLSFLSCGIFENEEKLDSLDMECEESFFVVVETMPQLIGGLGELQQSVTYPQEAIEAGVEGRVVTQFIVNKKGNVICPKVIRGIGGGCDEAALKAVEQAKFNPGMQNGEPVRVQYSLPIVFLLQN
tara:strand:+ start:19574 stop:19981 length:408 start_codon:yes stop_codon:yes gene_type:complete